jgi:hypothetical protein
MSPRHLIRIVGLIVACFAAVAFSGLAIAASNSHAGDDGSPPAPHKSHGKYCVKVDNDDSTYCLPYGPSGKTGNRGPRGAQGPVGAMGAVGLVGAVGAVGNQGIQGPRGHVGVTGPTGPTGAFGATQTAPGGPYTGGNTIIRVGQMIGPLFMGGVPTGTVVNPPAVARCPTSGIDKEAYSGGAIIKTTNGNDPNTPTSGDVVGLFQAYPGLFNGRNEVDPLPLGSAPHGVSTLAANAYEAQAVITELNPGDSVSIQAYVVCGP